MKVAVIGSGNVGMAVFANLKQISGIGELVLIGRNVEKVRGEVNDYLDASVLDFRPSPKLSYGIYADVKGADIIIYTAGAGRKVGQTRQDLMEENVKITEEIFTEVKPFIQDSIVICLSNPVDILTYVIREITGLPENKVMGSGTLLETARLQRFISNFFDISPLSVNACVIGEHGLSSCILWSSVRIANFDIDTYAKNTISPDVSMKKEIMDKYMKTVGSNLIAAKGSTAYGVASALSKVVSAIVYDTKEVLPVSTVMLEKYQVSNCAVSVPCIIGKEGIMDSVLVKMNQEEQKEFLNSTEILKELVLKHS